MEEVIIDFNTTDISDMVKYLDEILLHEHWDFISNYYHTEQEDKFILNILKGEEKSSFLDPSFGSGYLIDLLLKNNFQHIYTSDIPSNKFLGKKIDNNTYYKNVKYFFSHFQNLKSQTIKKNYDNIMVIGASLSYCQNWEKNKMVILNKEEILKSIEGLKSVLSKEGNLYIGNAKTYNSAYKIKKPNEIISFFDSTNNNLRVMRWTLEFDWSKLEKKWTCEIFDVTKNVIKEKFSLNSHLFTNEMLKTYCKEFFNDVEIIIAPEGCPEDIIKCTNPK